ncbi:MAG: tRNA (adenosine(37)-N6)-threonylcarbamoyltransferase complex transferase subunit TsaD [Bacteroidales bacterium]|jgi:N6-L-threonylcarbamoyladenine synthase|nr:tRNA (adenosine(37)-N6)-threonylcarbamoyltransferase complex transferase subunit TsaD [Bacteroidales bacterium]MDD4214996.1 tRNA (adenosine(37)-N6)-threonylcarbamoyltransferase complex transferase subunit TsaD [Bacteroidales bacterium]
MNSYILGIESSCDDTSAAVANNNLLLSNVVASQEIHKNYGGVVPEYASRAHQINIIPVIDHALQKANVQKNQLSAIAFTRGPGLLGSLIVGVSVAKAMALVLKIPMIEIDHIQAHVLSHFIAEPDIDRQHPQFPYLCLLVSGGHTQIIMVKSFSEFHTLSNTIDDAAGETFDKAAKILGLPYPGGLQIDKYARQGNPKTYKFPEPKTPDKHFSFSGLKTSFLYFIRDELKKDPLFIEHHIHDLCASIQQTIINILVKKLIHISEQNGIKEISISGGVSANSLLRNTLSEIREKQRWNLFLPKPEFCTDNAAMIAVAGYYKFLNNDFADIKSVPYTRYKGK